MTPFGTVELTVYPYECDAFGHLNQAALLTLLERARWDALARGPGMDLFDRNGVWPAVRKATIEYHAPAFARDVLRVETTVAGRGTTSMTLRHVVRRISDDAGIAEAEMVFVCIDRLGRATPIPEEIARFLGPRSSGGHQPIQVPVGDVELAVDVRGEGVPVLFVHGFPFDRTVWRHQLATLSRARRIALDLRGVGGSGVPPGADGYSLSRYADDLVAVLDALGVREAVLCGLSMGGYVIFELLRRHPERVRALILADTKPQADSADAKRGREELTRVAAQQGQDAVIERLLGVARPTGLHRDPPGSAGADPRAGGERRRDRATRDGARHGAAHPRRPVSRRPRRRPHRTPRTAPRGRPAVGRFLECTALPLKREPRGDDPGALFTIPCAAACRAGSRSGTRPGSWRCRTSTAAACLPPGRSR